MIAALRDSLRDAWTTLASRSQDRHGPLPRLLLGLTVVTGLVDAVSYLALGHVFVANMTGNVVFLAFALAGAPGFSLAASLTALAAFAAGALLGGLLVRRTGVHRGRVLLTALALETGLAAAALATAAPGGAHSYPAAQRYPLIVLLGLAMGLQNAVARALAVPDLTTTVLTLTITGIAADTTLTGGPGSRAGRRLLAAAAMFLGALAGAAALRHGSPLLPLAAVTALLAVLTAAAFAPSRATDSWIAPL
ncbi:YoaK family protein [Kitasatospora mediocidica]|uniref:YoaK family protein n=1 Tax=Kitasatospora mediocidica TaxID=58352 RepID=UPI0005606871|nr:YoaK family protein [Kitasatospora mediocidica]